MHVKIFRDFYRKFFLSPFSQSLSMSCLALQIMDFPSIYINILFQSQPHALHKLLRTHFIYITHHHQNIFQNNNKHEKTNHIHDSIINLFNTLSYTHKHTQTSERSNISSLMKADIEFMLVSKLNMTSTDTCPAFTFKMV